jgi:hypothetical protein
MSVDLKRILTVLEQQHDAIDTLMARIISMESIGKENRFRPSKSGPIWDAVQAGHQLIEELKQTASPN